MDEEYTEVTTWAQLFEALGVTIEIETEGPNVLMAKLTDEDLSAFISGANKRKRGPEAGGGKAAFLEYLKPHKFRVWALRHDLQWYMKEAQKRGISPDEAMKLLVKG